MPSHLVFDKMKVNTNKKWNYPSKTCRNLYTDISAEENLNADIIHMNHKSTPHKKKVIWNSWKSPVRNEKPPRK